MRWLTTLLTAGCLLAAPTASAQDVDDGSFSLVRYSPAPGPRNYFMVEGAQTPGDMQGSAGLVLDYGHRPFVLWDATCTDDTDCEVGDERAVLVEYVAAAHVTGTLQIADRFQIGLVVPIAMMHGDGFESPLPGREPLVIEGGRSIALADPRLTLKGRFFTDPDSGFSLGASAYVTAPTGQRASDRRQNFLGDRLPMFGGHLIAEIAQSGFRASANLGGTWREEVQLLSTVVGPQVTYGLGLGYDITQLVGVFAEVNGASTFTAQIDEHYLEWRLGGRLHFDDFDIHLAGGTGLPPFGVGTPLFRFVAGFQWAPIHLDTDGDGTEDDEDACPSEAEDMDGWEDEDGCPEEDNDSDGIRDGYDSCPNSPEDMDGDRDTDGCPDADTDGDGIEDGIDQCPNDSEDFDGYADDDGCPEEDVDGDGIPDEQDECAEEPEDMDGYRDRDGCPDDRAHRTRRQRGRE